MPARPDQLVALARRVRAIWERLAEASECAHELKLGRVRDQLLDLELKSVKLHTQLLELAKDPPALSADRYVSECDQEPPPF